jgi:hypothetical protein
MKVHRQFLHFTFAFLGERRWRLLLGEVARQRCGVLL